MKHGSFDQRAEDCRKKNYTLLQSVSFKDQDGTLYYFRVGESRAGTQVGRLENGVRQAFDP
jgi:hypothetical protein